MTRNLEYQSFLDFVHGREKDNLLPDEETIASVKEVGWWKQFQVGRAIRHARNGIATSVEIHLLEKHGISVSRMARRRTKLNEE